MQPLLLRSTLVFAVVLTAAMANPAFAQTPPAQPSQTDLKARCDQLIAYFDYYGTSRGENSDGARNHTRLGAGMDCNNGHYAEGVAAMETLLKQKNFDVPPPPTGIAQSPAPLRPHGELRHNSQ
jgi:hypothetical protein